jgi:hypothetical protein
MDRMMLKRTLLTALAAVGTLAFAASAQAAYLTLGTGNTSNAGTALTGNPSSAELLVRNTNGASANAIGLFGLLTATSPTAYAAAVRGYNSATDFHGYGVMGTQQGSGTGVYGWTPKGLGVWGRSSSGIGVKGTSSSNYGVYGTSGAKVQGAGVFGHGVVGVYGSGKGNGVFGYSENPGGIGVSGQSVSSEGVTGFSTNGYGVYGESSSSGAGYFKGNVTITGTCTGCTGPSALQIDDPLDPAHKYLQHSSVASSQQLDVYSGNVTTNGKGFATVRMPRWFQALNRSFRYQLTSLSGLQQVAVAKEMHGNRFTVQSQRPHSKVSWQVTAVRHDRFAKAHPVRVVAPKAKKDQGKYLHPELYGKPKSKGIGYQKPPQAPRKPVVKR